MLADVCEQTEGRVEYESKKKKHGVASVFLRLKSIALTSIVVICNESDAFEGLECDVRK